MQTAVFQLTVCPVLARGADDPYGLRGISSVWVLGSLGRRALALQMGGLAAASFGLLQFVGSLTEIVPCSGPA